MNSVYIPKKLIQIAQKYALGKYVINPAFTSNQALEQWIKNIDFEQFETDIHRLQFHSRKRNNLFSFYLPCVDKEVILKVSQISTHYSWHRKLNLYLVSLIKNYSLNAYYGGVAFESIDIDSLKVIAHWTCKRQNESKKSYLLYEKVTSSMSVFDFCLQLSEHNQHAGPIIERISKSLASVIRTIHSNNMRHGDPHTGNFLLHSKIPDIHQLAIGDVDQLKFTLIDLDKVQFVHNEGTWRKKIFDIRCMRRFNVHNIDCIDSLGHYLNRRPKLAEKIILKFWMRGGLNLYKWIKKNNKQN